MATVNEATVDEATLDVYPSFIDFSKKPIRVICNDKILYVDIGLLIYCSKTIKDMFDDNVNSIIEEIKIPYLSKYMNIILNCIIGSMDRWLLMPYDNQTMIDICKLCDYLDIDTSLKIGVKNYIAKKLKGCFFNIDIDINITGKDMEWKEYIDILTNFDSPEFKKSIDEYIQYNS